MFLGAAVERASQLGVSARLTFVQGDAGTYEADPGAFDIAACIGATWIGGGLAGTADLLRPAVRAGGLVLIGEPYWIDPPPDDALTAFGFARDDYRSLAGTLDRLEAADLELVEMVLADGDSWDRYEASQWRTIADWLNANPGDPDHDAMRELLDTNRRTYLRWGRRYLGGACSSPGPGGDRRGVPAARGSRGPPGVPRLGGRAPPGLGGPVVSLGVVSPGARSCPSRRTARRARQRRRRPLSQRDHPFQGDDHRDRHPHGPAPAHEVRGELPRCRRCSPARRRSAGRAARRASRGHAPRRAAAKGSTPAAAQPNDQPHVIVAAVVRAEQPRQEAHPPTSGGPAVTGASSRSTRIAVALNSAVPTWGPRVVRQVVHRHLVLEVQGHECEAGRRPGSARTGATTAPT